MKLTQKESGLIKDLAAQEKVCIEKYEFYAEQAKDPQLKKLFGQIGSQETQHYQSLSDVLTGKVPAASSTKRSAAQSYKPKASYTANGKSAAKKQDAFLCTDSITTEKYVSSAYDTDLFQFSSPAVRGLLNSIQTEEQHHAEMIYEYKTANGMA
ncbi:MAG: ferritin-like domain-containing protein [Faecalibacterium sp.]|jgi:rubrerythrin|nr:ferritin-like domain-containing protein [Faecalibacterium sp.]